MATASSKLEPEVREALLEELQEVMHESIMRAAEDWAKHRYTLIQLDEWLQGRISGAIQVWHCVTLRLAGLGQWSKTEEALEEYRALWEGKISSKTGGKAR